MTTHTTASIQAMLEEHKDFLIVAQLKRLPFGLVSFRNLKTVLNDTRVVLSLPYNRI